jgi:DNA gyrase inhibitor GyrI
MSYIGSFLSIRGQFESFFNSWKRQSSKQEEAEFIFCKLRLREAVFDKQLVAQLVRNVSLERNAKSCSPN